MSGTPLILEDGDVMSFSSMIPRPFFIGFLIQI